MNSNKIFLSSLMMLSAIASFSQETPQQQAAKTEVWQPVPKVVTPAAKLGDAPADAIILFNGDSLDQWVSSRDTTKPAAWTVTGDVFMVKKGTGNIQTRQKFTDYQLHIEWRVPKNITGSSQGRGNSGLFLAGYGGGDGGYEMQIMDSYNNPTYVNGQAGSIYKESIPLVNPTRPPGEWNVYDVVFTGPRFNADGTIKTPARITALFNGILVQNNYEIKGETKYIGKHEYIKGGHGPLPIKLQDHGDPSQPISFRNIWVRPL